MAKRKYRIKCQFENRVFIVSEILFLINIRKIMEFGCNFCCLQQEVWCKEVYKNKKAIR